MKILGFLFLFLYFVLSVLAKPDGSDNHENSVVGRRGRSVRNVLHNENGDIPPKLSGPIAKK